MTTLRSEERLRQSLSEITRLLDKHRVLEALAHRQEGPRRDLLEHLQHRQNLAELHKQPADASRGRHRLCARSIAARGPARPSGSRSASSRQAQVFVEVSAAVRESLVEVTSRERSGQAARDARSGGPRLRVGRRFPPTCWPKCPTRSNRATDPSSRTRSITRTTASAVT